MGDLHFYQLQLHIRVIQPVTLQLQLKQLLSSQLQSLQLQNYQ